MFTTIANLRRSDASPARVNTLESHLRTTYPGYTPQMHFPIFEIGLSNGDDDMEWVMRVTSTHSTAALPAEIREALGDTMELLRKGFISAAFGSSRGSNSENYTKQVGQYMERLQLPHVRIAMMGGGNAPELEWFNHHFLLWTTANASAGVGASAESETPMTTEQNAAFDKADASISDNPPDYKAVAEKLKAGAVEQTATAERALDTKDLRNRILMGNNSGPVKMLAKILHFIDPKALDMEMARTGPAEDAYYNTQVRKLLEQIDAAGANELTAADYEEALESNRVLVRELDVLLNGEDGAAKQASLCDIVSQVRRQGVVIKPL